MNRDKIATVLTRLAIMRFAYMCNFPCCAKIPFYRYRVLYGFYKAIIDFVYVVEFLRGKCIKYRTTPPFFNLNGIGLG